MSRSPVHLGDDRAREAPTSLPGPQADLGSRGAGAGGPAPIRLLVVDDDGDAREALATALHPEYDVVSAADGVEALAVARTGSPDIILLDLKMPRLDGFQVLERLGADPVTSRIPVLLISGRRDDAGKVQGLGLGAVDYLEKPFSAPELRARLERTVRILRDQSSLRELARTDPLTGLPNRRAFREHLEAESRRASRYRTALTCIMVDLDGLKAINDEWGHAAGDAAISAVASALRRELRETDFVARFGGDEFVMLLPHTGAADGRGFAERVCGRLAQTDFQVAAQRVALGASFGVACLEPGDHLDGEALLRAADQALYRAKEQGRGRVEVAPRAAMAGPGC